MNTRINDLPVELYPFIFRNLSAKDLFNCRSVNRKFKDFSDHSDHIYKLVINEPDLNDDYWYYNNEYINDDDIIDLKLFKKINSLSIFNLNKNLKYLRINKINFCLGNELSNFKNLEVLENKHLLNKKTFKNINSDNLRFFYSKFEIYGLDKFEFYFFAFTSFKTELNTPKLEKIQFNDLHTISFKSNPESIKHLITDKYTSDLNVFRNLEIIEIIKADYVINENLLSVFKNLKKLVIYLDYSEFRNIIEENIERSLISILNNRLILERDIDIYYEGFEIMNVDKLFEIKKNRNKLEYQIENYDLLDFNLQTIKRLNYQQLENCFHSLMDDLPNTFFDKYSNVSCVNVHKNRVNNSNLIWFLRNLKRLNSLTISDNSFDETFYNNLPITIRYLNIDNDLHSDLNYDFIFKLTRLTYFTALVNKDFFDYVFKSFSNLRCLVQFTFSFKNKHICIRKEGTYFNLKLDLIYLENELNNDQLLELCNEIKSKLNVKKRKIDEE